MDTSQDAKRIKQTNAAGEGTGHEARKEFLGMKLPHLATERYRWIALLFIALGLAIVIIDNSVLNVAIPNILRDLNTSLVAIQWVVSGYALIIATLLITMGRLGDLFGRKRILLLGITLFVMGSLIASLSQTALILFIGEAIIEAIGASMMLTSSIALLASEFQGRERAIAFGIWGSVAGASATVGPLLGGYLTAFYSWRWSLRINVIVGIIALLGSVFIKESRGESERNFDWLGTFLSGLGLGSLIFSFIEAKDYGWWLPLKQFSLFGIAWPLKSISIVPFTLLLSVLALAWFVRHEHVLEKAGLSPLLRLSMFRDRGFSTGLAMLCIMAFGQIGVFFIMPIYLENVLGLNAFQTGLVLIFSSASIFLLGSISGFIASKINLRYLVNAGTLVVALGVFLIIRAISANATVWTLAPALIVFGIGFGLGASQLNNIIISSAPLKVAGEASAASATMRQVGASLGTAVIGAILVGSLVFNIAGTIHSDTSLTPSVQQDVISNIGHIDVESGQISNAAPNAPKEMQVQIRDDINKALSSATRSALTVSFVFVFLGAIISFFLPNFDPKTGQPIRKNARGI